MQIGLRWQDNPIVSYNNSFLKSIVSFKSGPVEIMVTGTPVSV